MNNDDYCVKRNNEHIVKTDVYKECPTFKKEKITLRKTNTEDATELLKCYSDKLSVPFFNSDNCEGDKFYYQTLEQMTKAIEFWKFSYDNKYFVRWTIILNSTNEKIGTLEMFNRGVDSVYNQYGVLRIDLQSKYEEHSIIEEILEIANENFYKYFNVDTIATKAISQAETRISVLKNNGYNFVGNSLVEYDDYYCREVLKV
jgi:ribosomal-protein-alanine N-acetyltransferase